MLPSRRVTLPPMLVMPAPNPGLLVLLVESPPVMVRPPVMVMSAVL